LWLGQFQLTQAGANSLSGVSGRRTLARRPRASEECFDFLQLLNQPRLIVHDNPVSFSLRTDDNGGHDAKLQPAAAESDGSGFLNSCDRNLFFVAKPTIKTSFFRAISLTALPTGRTLDRGRFSAVRQKFHNGTAGARAMKCTGDR
jgi:hypothetical protein